MQQPRQWEIPTRAGIVKLTKVEDGATGEYRGHRFLVRWSPEGSCFYWEVIDHFINGSFAPNAIRPGFQKLLAEIDELVSINAMQEQIKQNALSTLYSSFDQGSS